MDKNNDSPIFDSRNTNYGCHSVCKICKDMPVYAGMYLQLRESEKIKEQNKDDQCIDLAQMKYYYALLHLLDEIHSLPECPNPESKSADCICPTPEHFDHYRKVYNTYADFLMTEYGLEKINLKCDICAVLPYALFSDLDMIAKNMHVTDMEETQKLELDAIVADFYLAAIGHCKRWDECSQGVDWLELMNIVQILKEYLRTKDNIALQIVLSDWNKVRANDAILNTGVTTTSMDFRVQDTQINMLAGKTLVYLDFSVYQLYETNEDFCMRLDTCMENDEVQFIYSPTHMEEVCRMDNSVYESRRWESVSKICGNFEVLPVDGYLKILMEPIDACFARAKKFQQLNNFAEEAECAGFESLEERTCRVLGWSEKEMDTKRKAISAMTSIQLFDPNNKIIDNETLNRVFRLICGSNAPLEEFSNYCKTERTFSGIRDAIRRLYMLMNAIGFHRNKVERRTKFTHEALYPTYSRKFYRTIRSGFYDVDHLCYASKCDYFVTCDYVLSLQATEIYRYLGFKTQVIYCEK